jgi:hypothetical protein
MAHHRCQLSRSPKNKAAPITTAKDVACKIAEALDKGVKQSLM